MPSLTSHLLNLDQAALSAATNHPFLVAAATSVLPEESIKRWLAQDRLYALAYTNFIGTLLSLINIPSSADRSQTLEWRVADLLIDCLTNIRAELKLFEDAAQGEGWLDDISNPEPLRATRSYQDLFAGATAQGRPLIVGLVVLWATEECYLRSWRYAWSRVDQSVRGKDRDVMQRVFIPNWSSAEFEAFVRKLGAVVNKMSNEWGIEEGGWIWKECETAFKQVLWAETAFWPNVDEEGKALDSA